jgi:hypothetical protein
MRVSCRHDAEPDFNGLELDPMSDDTPTVTPTAPAFREAFRRALAASADPEHPQALLRAAAAACREELTARWARTQAADRRDADGRRVHYMSMEFLMGRALSNALAALGWTTSCARRWPPPAPALHDVLEARARRRARQRRPGPPGGVFPGLLRHAGPALLRLRPALRVRHVRAGHPERPPGRAPRPLAAPGQPVGDDAARVALPGRLRRPRGDVVGSDGRRWQPAER